MASFKPFLLRIFHGGNVTYHNGVVSTDQPHNHTAFPVTSSFSYEFLVNAVYTTMCVRQEDFSLRLLLSYEWGGRNLVSEIIDDNSLNLLFYLAANHQTSYMGDIYVMMSPVTRAQQNDIVQYRAPEYCPYNQESTQYQSLHEQFPFENTNHYQSHQEQSYPENNTTQYDVGGSSTRVEAREDVGDGFDNSDVECVSTEASEDEGNDLRNEDIESDEDGYTEPTGDLGMGKDNLPSQASMSHEIDYSVLRELEAEDEFVDDHMDIWDHRRNVNDIHQGMCFVKKSDLMFAVRKWNIEQGRELYVADSKPNRWRAKCKTTSVNYAHYDASQPQCEWMVSACSSTKDVDGFWTIKKWVRGHNCFGSSVRNNNTSLQSRTLANYIDHSIRKSVTYPVNQIQAYCKETLRVDVGYLKAWRARRHAIENIYGTWESNFKELPQYIDALKRANPETVVEWLHHPTSSSNSFVFKFVFWAFGPCIKAFSYCRPVISVDGTHLRGGYKGKLLVAVSKDANNYILPLAYAIVDEESKESWSWFLEMLGTHVKPQQTRPVCVLSDRHVGIINAMANLPAWQEPNGFHRFCLLHIRSNVMSKFKSVKVKRLCWLVGCTSNPRKYRHYKTELRKENEDALKYLTKIGVDKWTLSKDAGCRRWGNLTTNISESLNNSIRGGRMLPIKAMIQYTFDKAVAQFAKHREIAVNWNNSVTPRVFAGYNLSSGKAREHKVVLYNFDSDIYNVISKQYPNDVGCNEYTVSYKTKQCSCYKWQNYRI